MSKGIKLTSKQKELVEQYGILSEKSGLQPAASRVLALLTIADKTSLSFDEIMETLSLSKGATSGAINLLLSLKRIEYITFTGDRKRYFKTKLDNWRTEMAGSLETMVEMNVLFKEILNNRTKTTVEFNNNLKDIVSFLEFLHKEIPVLFKKWENSQK